MMSCRVWRVSGEELFGFFRQSIKNMELRAVIGEHMLNQFKARYQDFHRATAFPRSGTALSNSFGTQRQIPVYSSKTPKPAMVWKKRST